MPGAPALSSPPVRPQRTDPSRRHGRHRL